MVIKTVKFLGPADKPKKKTKEKQWPCSHIEVSRDEEGIVIELCGAVPGAPKFIRLPEDADEAYSLSDSGKTQDSWKWPPREPVGHIGRSQ